MLFVGACYRRSFKEISNHAPAVTFFSAVSNGIHAAECCRDLLQHGRDLQLFWSGAHRSAHHFASGLKHRTARPVTKHTTNAEVQCVGWKGWSGKCKTEQPTKTTLFCKNQMVNFWWRYLTSLKHQHEFVFINNSWQTLWQKNLSG